MNGENRSLLTNEQLKFKTAGKSLIILEESMGYKVGVILEVGRQIYEVT
jgi:hypothetical protein